MLDTNFLVQGIVGYSQSVSTVSTKTNIFPCFGENFTLDDNVKFVHGKIELGNIELTPTSRSHKDLNEGEVKEGSIKDKMVKKTSSSLINLFNDYIRERYDLYTN